MVVLNVIEIDATFVEIPLWNLNHFLVFRRAKKTPFIPDFLVILKTSFTWLLARNVACNMWDLPPLTLEFGFAITSRLCSQTKQLLSQQCILIKSHTFQVTFYLICIDQVQVPNTSEEVDRILITTEAYWSAQLFSLAPHGLKKRKEFHSKNEFAIINFFSHSSRSFIIDCSKALFLDFVSLLSVG